MSKPFYYGTDDVIYAVNSFGHVYLTVEYSPLKDGYVRKVARTAAEKESVWKTLDRQEREQASLMTEKLYSQRKDRIAIAQSNIRQRNMAGDCSAREREFNNELLKILDRKERILNTSSVYGIAEMQKREAPAMKVADEERKHEVETVKKAN